MPAWKRMDLPQRVAALALIVLALLALVAALTGCSAGDDQSGRASASFTADSAGKTSTGHKNGREKSAQRTRQADGSPESGASEGAGDDASSTIALSALPQQARETVALIDAGGPYPYSRDGVVFGNYERHLPKKPRGWYHEYTVPTPGSANRGAKRIIAGQDKTLYYTADHYETFRKVVR